MKYISASANAFHKTINDRVRKWNLLDTLFDSFLFDSLFLFDVFSLELFTFDVYFDVHFDFSFDVLLTWSRFG